MFCIREVNPRERNGEKETTPGTKIYVYLLTFCTPVLVLSLTPNDLPAKTKPNI